MILCTLENNKFSRKEVAFMVFNKANILIPDTDLNTWSVVACDQYTSEKDYWDKVKENVHWEYIVIKCEKRGNLYGKKLQSLE